MKKLIIALIFTGSLFCSNTAHAQIDIKFSPTTDLSQFVFSGASYGVIENKKILKVTVEEGKNWAAIFYRPAGGMSLGSDKFFVIKSSKKSHQLKIASSNTSGYKDGKSVKCSESEFFITTYRLADFKPQNPLTEGESFSSLSLHANGLTGGDIVMIEWVKSFPNETSALQYVKTVEKVDAQF